MMSSSGYINVIAIVTPASGNADRVQELLTASGTYVLQNEPSTLKYNITREVNTKGEPQFIIIEQYADSEALKKHSGATPFKELGRSFKRENLLAKPLEVKFVKLVAGFDSRSGSKL